MIILTDEEVAKLREALEQLIGHEEVNVRDDVMAVYRPARDAANKAELAKALFALAILDAAHKVGQVAWCSKTDFSDSAKKRQSFNGWTTKYSDCDMSLYARTE